MGNTIIKITIVSLFIITGLIIFTGFLNINDLVSPDKIDSLYVVNRAKTEHEKIKSDTISFNPSSLGLEYTSLGFYSSDSVHLNGWFVPATSYTSNTLLLVHGLGESRIAYLEMIRQFHDRGFNVCIFDMRAHGSSGGDFGTLGVKEADDVREIIDLLYRLDTETRLAIIGSGTGAAAAIIESASDARVQGLILLGVYNNLPSFVKKYSEKKWGRLSRFVTPLIMREIVNKIFLSPSDIDMTSYVKAISVPSFFVSFTGSYFFPVKETKQVYDSCKSADKAYWQAGVIPEGRTLYAGNEEYYNRLAVFIVKALPKKFKKTRFKKLTMK
jgi:hypothetical protein